MKELVRVVVWPTFAVSPHWIKGDQKIGVDLEKRSLEAPIRQIANNAGQKGSVVTEKVKNEKGAFGFDAAQDEYTDMIKAGIIDPTKVVRLALQNAASVASLMITTQAIVADKPEKKAPYPPMPPGGGGMGGMGDMY